MIRLILALLFLISIVSCKRDRGQSVERNDTLKQTTDTLQRVEQTRRQIGYNFFALNDSTRRSLRTLYDSTQLKIILALNRVDEKYLGRLDTLVIPDTITHDFIAYAPFPQRLQLIDSVEKLLLCSYPSEAVAAYENGKLVRWAPASLGKKSTPTPLGLFHTNWKAKQTVSTENEDWILNWYFNLTNFTGVSLHQYELPGYPASHACVRLREEDAKWIYYWAEQWRLNANDSILARGTPVIIYGSYNFKGRKPWLALPLHPDSMNESEAMLHDVIAPHLPTILLRQAQLDSVKAVQTLFVKK